MSSSLHLELKPQELVTREHSYARPGSVSDESGMMDQPDDDLKGNLF